VADKGGLDYVIRVQDDFSANLKGFEAGVQSAQQAATQFKNDLSAIGGTAPALKQAANAIKGLGNPSATRKINEASRNIRLLAGEVQGLGAHTRGLGDIATGLSAIKAASRNIGGGSRGFTALINGIERLQRSLNSGQIATSVTRLNQLSAAVLRLGAAIQQVAPQFTALVGHLRGIGPAARAAQTAINGAGGAARNAALGAQVFQTQLASVNRTANSGGGIFDTLLGRLRAFVEFRTFAAISQGFLALVQGGIDFNSQLEQAEISLAAIFASAGRVRNVQGQLVEGAEAFAAAQGVAAEQIQQLRRDAILTTATFDELLTAFRQGLAPGLAAGLNVDQVRQVTVTLSQAAAAVGIEGRQFAEEIRSILAGTGTRQNTRLLQLLPDDFNDQVRKAREAGTLFQFLNKSFAQFNLLGVKISGTFEARLSRVKDSIQAVVGTGAIPFFEAIKSLLTTIGDQLVEVNLDGVTPKPQAVEAFRGISDGLAAVVKEVERVVNELTADDVQAIGALIADSFRLAAAVIGPLTELFIRAFNQAATLIDPVVRGLTLLASQSRVFFSFLVGIGKSLGDLFVTFAQEFPFTSSFVGATAAVTALAAALTGTLGPAITAVLAPLLAFFGIVGLFQALFASITGTTLSFADTIRAISLLTVRFLNTLEVRIQRIKILAKALSAAMSNPLSLLKKGFVEETVGADLDKLSQLEDDAKHHTDAIDRQIAALYDRVGKKAEASLFTNPIQALRDLQAEVQKIFQEEAARQLPRTQTRTGTVEGRDRDIDLEAEAKRRITNIEIVGQTEINRLTREGQLAKAEALATDLKIAALMVERGRKEAELQKLGEAQTDQARLLSAEISKLITQEQALSFELEKQRQIANSPVTAGIQEAFAEFRDTAQVTFEATTTLLQQSVSSFSSFIAQSIADAFDPSKDTSILERFGQFLQQLGTMIFQLLAQIAIAKAVIAAINIIGGVGGAIGGAAPQFDAFAGPSVVGFAAEGGAVPSGLPAAPSIPGVPASDTVAARLTPGEYVHTTGAVDTYGLQVMEAINRGLVDPTALKALAGFRGTLTPRRPRVQSFAKGGQVGGGPGLAQGGPTVAVLKADDQAVEQLLTGGGAALLRYVRDNSASFNNALRG
jgi:hypothetical protein